MSGEFKVGAKARFKEKVQNSDLFSYDPEEDYAMVDFLSSFTSQTPFVGGRYDNGLFADPGAIRSLLRDGSLRRGT